MQATSLGDTKALAKRLSEPKTYGHFIDGAWVDGASGEKIALSNPATGQHLGYIQAGNATDVDRAVNAAHRAFPKWAKVGPSERQSILREIVQRMKRRHLDYAMMESLNNGKTITEAHGHDIAGAIGLFDFYSGAPFQLHGEVHDYADSMMLVHKEPIGVVAQIIPWNVPLLMAAMKLAPALAAGCTVVLKPAETVCISVLEFVNDIADLLPPGVVNIVTGYGQAVGEPLVSHPKVRKVAFTGSRPTAQKIVQYASINLIPQSLELGGKSANIVCEDADIEASAESAVITTIFNKGEVCLAGSRVFVHDKVADAFTARFKEMLEGVRQGDPTDPATGMGAQASKVQFDKVRSYLELARREGATAITGGEEAAIAGHKGGFFVKPTIYTNVRNDMRIAQEEIFGPVTCIMRWNDENEMLQQANDSIYGLGGGIWTRNLTRAHRMARALETGTVWINRYYNFKPGLPIGGFKQSGYGREQCMETLQHYLVSKGVVVNLEEGPLGKFFAPPPTHEDF